MTRSARQPCSIALRQRVDFSEKLSALYISTMNQKTIRHPQHHDYKYMARLFAPDGESVTDCQADSIEDVRNQVGDLGSRWIFYPVAVVVRYCSSKERGRIVAAPDELAHWQGRTCGAFSRALAAASAALPERIETTREPDVYDLMAAL